MPKPLLFIKVEVALKKVEDILRAVSDGDVSPNTAKGVIEAWSEHLRKTSIRIKDWQDRLASLDVETKKSTAA